jgi:tetratricopeptide (TPR) repeat protein
VGSIVLRGRVGSGRKTAARALGRALIAEGWMGIWNSPGQLAGGQGTGEERVRDPVLVARELGRQSEGRDVVLSWPERAGSLDVRILRAFLAAREDASAAARTLVLKAGPIEGVDEDGEWLKGTTRNRVEEWISPGPEAMASIQADLFPPEEGIDLPPASSAKWLPLALVHRKQSLLGGDGISPELPAALAIEEEMERLWERASSPAREALVLLSWSDAGWALEDAGMVLGWAPGVVEVVMAEIDTFRVTRRTFERGKPLDRLTDEMTRGALLRRSQGIIPEPSLDGIARMLDMKSPHEGDLGLARRLLQTGRALPRYLLRSLDEALAAGRYAEMLEFGRELETLAAGGEASLKELWLRILQAAQHAGKYEEEVRTLRRLLLTSEGAAAIEERKMLAQALGHLGDWHGALEQCSGILNDGQAKSSDRTWAALQRAETLWQAGRFADADLAYEAIEPELTAAMAAEWLRFAVGRARQYGQRGDMAGVKRYLDLAVAKVGNERCRQDPMYLNTLGGLLIEKAELEDARPILGRASEIAERERDWKAYIMILSRAGSLIYDLGEMREAERIGRKAITTAEALASARMLGFTSSYLGYPETHLGRVGSAWRRAQRVLDLSQSLSDVNLEILGHRLRVFIASNVGLREELEESAELARAAGERAGEREISAFVFQYYGVFHLGNEHFEEASECFERAREAYRILGQEGGELKSRLYLLIAKGKSQFGDDGVEELGRIQKEAQRKHQILLVPITKLAQLILDQEFRARNPGQAAKILLGFWSEGRLLDLLHWASLGLLPARGGVDLELRGKVLSAVQKIADSLDDAQLRTEFLGFARTRKTLKLLSG